MAEKKEGFKKIVFYTGFAALGLFWAEVISTNVPDALVHPFFYLAYGLLYVFFIDALMRSNSGNFAAWYLFGVLVGLITETYVAKVVFFGTIPDAPRILGVAPGAIIFIIIFYHAFFSFLAPAYMAKRVLNMPLPARPGKWTDLLILLAPFIIAPAVGNQIFMFGRTVPGLMALMGISAVILSFWILLLRYMGDIKNVLLSQRQRRGLLLFTVLMYIVFLLKATNRHHGHAPLDFPMIPMLAVSAVIFALLALVFKALAKEEQPGHEVPYSARSMNLPVFFGWLVWHLAMTALLMFFCYRLRPLFEFSLGLLGIAGASISVVIFVSSVFRLIKRILPKTKAL